MQFGMSYPRFPDSDPISALGLDATSGPPSMPVLREHWIKANVHVAVQNNVVGRVERFVSGLSPMRQLKIVI